MPLGLCPCCLAERSVLSDKTPESPWFPPFLGEFFCLLGWFFCLLGDFSGFFRFLGKIGDNFCLLGAFGVFSG